MKKKRRSSKLLVTVWKHPFDGQNLVLPGTKRQTRKLAREYLSEYEDENGAMQIAKRLKGVEEMWSNKRLTALPEYGS